jgi:xanthine dehydrogenase YagR molybdenum-binding subunit
MIPGVQLPPRSPRAIGAPLDRIDGPLKVTGAAKYAYEYPVAGVTYVFPVQSTIAKGRVVSIDASAARALPGVIAVLSHENAPWQRAVASSACWFSVVLLYSRSA